jgi:6-phosphogluconolactonase
MPMRPGLRRVVLPFIFFAAAASPAMSRAATYVYVSNADSREISVLRLDAPTNDLLLVQTVPVTGQVMPLAISPDKKFLYAALRSQPYSVASFRIDAGTGRLEPIGVNALPDSMAYVLTDRTGRWLFAASYGGHKMSVSPIGADGVALPATQVLPTGQNAHAVLVAPGNRDVFVSNLGSDVVMQMRFDAATGTLSPNAVPTFNQRPKAGPRHLVMHPDGRHVYLINELDASVDVLAYDAAAGTLSVVQTLSTLPAGFTGKPWAADLHLTPDGRFLYTSERTTNTLATFGVDATSGKLTSLAHTPTERQPRGFNIDPSGRYLVAVGQLSHAVTLYAIDPQNGALKPLKNYSLGQNPNWVEIVNLP